MSDDKEFWHQIAKQAGVERNGRDLKRSKIAGQLDWDDWTNEEREVYACAFLFPAPAEPLIDGITILGKVLNLSKYARTAVICDRDGNVWRVVEHGRPQKL